MEGMVIREGVGRAGVYGTDLIGVVVLKYEHE